MRLFRIFAVLAAIAFLNLSLTAQTTKKSNAAPKAAATKAAATDKAKAADKTEALVDINHATAADLKVIPGIGDAYSAAIIKGRPYANKTQLKSRNVIPGGVYEKIKDKIIAKQ